MHFDGQERKGFVTEADLEVYASSAGLPASYARSFVSAVLGPGNSGGFFGTGRRRRAISFPAFLAFVKTREAALMAAFNHFGKHLLISILARDHRMFKV